MQEGQKPFAPSCERNQEPILDKLKNYLIDGSKIFEIGSGTAQHALFFSNNLPNIQWTTSERKLNHDGIKQWLVESLHSNINGPREYEIGLTPIPAHDENIAFSANVIHIVSADLVEILISDLGKSSIKTFIAYGPYNYGGEFTSPSNAQFDVWLKNRNELSGIRDIEWVTELMQKQNFELVDDHQMPANNRLIVFQRP